ncbi:hypothetical protein MKX03_020388 [Papaver bracteatum]|nr:hypothetical protein MKX03_020388 [Papaver bracteatum]
MILSFSISNNNCAQGQCLNDQKALLLQLNHSLNASGFSTSSGFSSKRSSWRLQTDCCTSWQGIKCDRDGHVISLDLSSENIIGGINDSSSLFDLQYLERLNLANNSFGDTDPFSETGSPIPSGLGRLASLSYLNLSSSGFIGQIPINIARMTKLVVLDFSGNYRLILSDPDFKTLTRNLTGLRELALGGVNISAEVPEFFGDFYLNRCEMYGKFPKRILQLQALRRLDLMYNEDLQGSLPEFPLNGMLQELVLLGTSFAGEIPYSIGNLKSLSMLDLNDCNFNGSVPSSVSKLTQLQYLDLSENSFTGQASEFLTGSTPTSVSMLNQLQYLDISYNCFTGQIGEFFIGSSSPLRHLDLGNNQLQGRVPRSIFKFFGLNHLGLGSNDFSDSNILDVPFHKFTNLYDLDLSNIRFSCNLREIPTFLENNSQELFHVDLSRNQIRGKIPNWISKFANEVDFGLDHLNFSANYFEDPDRPILLGPHLYELDLHSNLLQGKIPILSSSAAYLDYSSNNFTSMIPNVSYYVSNARFFSISNNQINGEIPTSLCESRIREASQIQILDLSDNNFVGRIPQCLLFGIPDSQSIRSLIILNLRGNNLQGIIPDKFLQSCELKKLDLNGNKLEGKLPRSLSNCTTLEILDVGNNKLTGTFPTQLGSMMAQLRVLVLRSNRLYGPWGSKGRDCNFPKLQIIDISFNNFSGIISKECFSNWTSIMLSKKVAKGDPDEVLGFATDVDDVNYQEIMTITIKGVVMEVGKILDSFTTVDFSNNQFEGKIPESIGNLRLLYTLNFSRNAFTGPIPPSIGNLTHLESLDLSQNKLIGEIPVQLASLSSLAVMNLSFNKLVGKIPSGSQFQTFNSSAFEGNNGLCGFPLDKNCSSNIVQPPQNVLSSKDRFDWILFIVTFLGFLVGASMVIGPQYFWKKGREWVNERINKILNIA